MLLDMYVLAFVRYVAQALCLQPVIQNLRPGSIYLIVVQVVWSCTCSVSRLHCRLIPADQSCLHMFHNQTTLFPYDSHKQTCTQLHMYINDCSSAGSICDLILLFRYQCSDTMSYNTTSFDFNFVNFYDVGAPIKGLRASLVEAIM